MEIPIDLYNRLSEEDLNILPAEVDLQTGADAIALQKAEQQMMENGLVVAKYLTKLSENSLFQGIGEIDSKGMMSALKSTNNAPSKLHNWNIITKQLDRIGIQIDSDERSLLVAGDQETIVTLLFKLYQMELELSLARDSRKQSTLLNLESTTDLQQQQYVPDSPSKLSIKEYKPEQPISILSLKTSRPLDETETTLEFVIVSLCQALEINTKQAAGLLTDYNYFLMTACVKGVKGDHTPILRWYQLLIKSAQHLVDLAVESLPMPENELNQLNDSQIVEDDTRPLFVMLGALKCGFFSDYFAVSDLAFRLFSTISSMLNDYGYQKVFRKWLLQKPDSDNGKLGGGLEATLYMLNKHSQIVESVAILLISSFKGNIDLLIAEIKENHIKDNLPKLYTLINDLLPFLHRHNREEVTLKLLSESPLISDLLKQADTIRTSDNPLKSACLSLLAEIWSLEPALISENQGGSVLDQYLKVFKNTVKFSSKALKLATLGLMFKLLDQFALSRDSQAPVIYKLLTFALIENIEDSDIREYMLVSFQRVFVEHRTIPVSILAEPLLRMLQMNDIRYTTKLNTHDFHFFTMLANHPKLTPSPLGLLMLDQMAKILLSTDYVVWASSAKSVFQILARRFSNEGIIQDFLGKFATVCITSVLELNKQPQPLITPKAGSTMQKAYHEQDILRRLKLSAIINIVEFILSLKCTTPIQAHQSSEHQQQHQGMLNNELYELILQTNRQFKQQYQHYNKGLLHLLEHFHQFDALQQQEMYDMEEDKKNHGQEEEELNQDEIETLKKDYESHIHEDVKGRFSIKDQPPFDGQYSSGPDIGDGGINHIDYYNHEEGDYFKLLPSETRNSEISSTAIHNINNQSQISKDSHRPQPLTLRRTASHQGSRQLVPYNPNNIVVQNKPPLVIRKVGILAHQKIEAIKVKRDEKAQKQQADEERRKAQMEKQSRKAKEEVQKRKIKLGINRGGGNALENDENQQQLVLYESKEDYDDAFGPINPKRYSMPSQSSASSKGSQLIEIKLIDLDNDEEERDRDGVKIIMQRYSKVFKFLFNKYALSRSQHSKVENFEYFNGENKHMNSAEYQKLLRDHDLLVSLTQTSILAQVVITHENTSAYQKISKDQVGALIRQINLRSVQGQKRTQQDLQSLTYPQFLESIPQLAHMIYTKTLPHMPLPDMLLKLLQHMERATKLKGQSTLLYEDPDITTIGDSEMIRELNKRVNAYPDFILPEGYYKVQEKDQLFRWELPTYLQVSEGQRVAVEVLDGIVNQSLGFHILEALVTYEARYKVRPRIKHTGSAKSAAQNSSADQPTANSALSYMRPLVKPLNILNRDRSHPSVGNASPSNIRGGMLQPLPQIEKGEVRPKLGVDLKIHTVQYQMQRPPFERQMIQDTAEVIEELLQAVELGLDKLPERPKLGQQPQKEELKNKALEDKQLRLKQEQLSQKVKEDLRKNRHKFLMDEIDKQKQEKLKLQEEQKALVEEQEKEKKLKEKRDRSLANKKIENKRLQIEEVKKKKQEEQEEKKRVEEEKIKQEKQARQKDQKEFFKKQKEQLETEFQKKRQEQEEAEKVKKEMEEVKKQLQDNVKNKMVNFMKQNKDQLRNEQAEWQEIQTFYDNSETQALFNKFDKSLNIMFKQFAVMDKKDMSMHSLLRINFAEFTKFGYQQKLIPKVLSNDDMVLIFRALVRERASTMTQKEIDYLGIGVNSLGVEDFKKALIRICILGQAKLGGSQEEDLLEQRLMEYQENPDLKPQQPPSLLPQSRAQPNFRIRGRSQMNSGASNRNKLMKQNSSAALQEQEPSSEQQDGLQPPDHTNNNSQLATNKRTSLARKTKEQKLLEELSKAKERQEKMINMKIEDKRMTKGFDASIIRPRTLEALIQYLQLIPNDERRAKGHMIKDKSMDFISSRAGEEEFVEIQNQQPNEEYADDGYHQQASQSAFDNQGNMEDNDQEEMENIIGPNGQQEQWKVSPE